MIIIIYNREVTYCVVFLDIHGDQIFFTDNYINDNECFSLIE